MENFIKMILLLQLFFNITNTVIFKTSKRFIRPTFESKKFEYIRMIADLGRIFGIFLNISMINIVEFFVIHIIQPILNCNERFRIKRKNFALLDIQNAFIIENGKLTYMRESLID